jgi:hypothetical protein
MQEVTGSSPVSPTNPVTAKAMHVARPARWRTVIVGVLVCILAGCSVADVIGPAVPPGGRLLIIPVTNHSPRPATLFVRNADLTEEVGSTSPSSVLPGAKVDVTFAVPPGQDWMILINAGPPNGGIVAGQDVPLGVAGKLPLAIEVDANGNQSVSAPNRPGWFGN